MNLFKNRKIVFSALGTILIAIVVFFTILSIAKSHELTEIETIAIENFANQYVNYFDKLDTDEENADAKYIAFAVAYIYGEKQQDHFSSEEITVAIKDAFNLELTTESIQNAADSSYLNQNSIRYEPEEDSFVFMNTNPGAKFLAVTPVTKYFPSDTRKNGKDFAIVYDKFVFDKPYDVLNCISANNPEHSADAMSYLDGKAPLAKFTAGITRECAESLVEPQKQTNVTFSIADGKIYIKNLE